MRKNLMFFIIFLFAAIPNYAQKEKDSFLWKIDKMFNLSSLKKIDTNYYTIANNGWMINLNNNFAVVDLGAEIKNVPLYGKTELNAHSRFNYQVSTTFGYRNLILGCSLANLVGEAKDFTLSLSANAWGFEFRRLETDDFDGEMENNLLGSNFKIKRGDIKVKTRHLRAYHVFNSKKFSLTAAIDQRCVQKHSAGSLLFYTNFSQNNVYFQNNTIVNHFDNTKEIEFSSASLGLGYAYNYTPNKGKLLFHLSAIPMFVAMNNAYLYSNTIEQIDTKHKYFFNLMGRFTINYRFNDFLGINLSAFYNNLNQNTKKDLNIKWNDILFKATLCCRF